MVRRISLSQLQSHLREVERRQRQAIDQYNQELRRRNDRARRAVDDYNRNLRRAVDDYNREARAHNSRVMANRQRLRSAIENLRRQPVATRYVTFRTSVETLSNAYVRLERHPDTNLGPDYDRLVDLSEREAANSGEVMNSLLDSPSHRTGRLMSWLTRA